MRREFVFLLGGRVYDFYVGRMCISHVVGYDNASSRTGFQAVLIFLVFVVLIMIFVPVHNQEDVATVRQAMCGRVVFMRPAHRNGPFLFSFLYYSIF